MNIYVILLVFLLIVSWGLFGLYYFQRDKSLNQCPPGFDQFGENGSMCCDGTLTDWDKSGYYKTCKSEKKIGVCKLIPNNDYSKYPYCYNSDSLCSNLNELQELYPDKDIQSVKKLHDCN